LNTSSNSSISTSTWRFSLWFSLWLFSRWLCSYLNSPLSSILICKYFKMPSIKSLSTILSFWFSNNEPYNIEEDTAVDFSFDMGIILFLSPCSLITRIRWFNLGLGIDHNKNNFQSTKPSLFGENIWVNSETSDEPRAWGPNSFSVRKGCFHRMATLNWPTIRSDSFFNGNKHWIESPSARDDKFKLHVPIQFASLSPTSSRTVNSIMVPLLLLPLPLAKRANIWGLVGKGKLSRCSNFGARQSEIALVKESGKCKNWKWTKHVGDWPFWLPPWPFSRKGSSFAEWINISNSLCNRLDCSNSLWWWG